MLVSSRLKLISLITMFYFPFLFAGGHWSLVALFWSATKRENPNNPVNPVYIKEP